MSKRNTNKMVFANNAGGFSTLDDLLLQAGIPIDANLIAETSPNVVSIMNKDLIDALDTSGIVIDLSPITKKLREINEELEAIVTSIYNCKKR